MELLIEDVTPQEGNIITEAKVNGNDVWLHGVMMQAGIKNRNGRIYPLSEMVNAVNTANNQIREHGGIFGELDHPQGVQINMDRISHVIKELNMSGNNVHGKIHLISTPMGLIAKELAKSGVRYGVSSRGVGQVAESGEVSGFAMVTIDLVATPSAPGAMPLPVYESLQELRTGRAVMTLAESMREDADAQKYFKKEFRKYLDELLSKKS